MIYRFKKTKINKTIHTFKNEIKKTKGLLGHTTDTRVCLLP